MDRLRRSGADKNCIGEYGINSLCHWNGLAIVSSGVGTMGTNHAKFIDSSLAAVNRLRSSSSLFAASSSSNSTIIPSWNFCSWHKNQRLYQTGDKKDETGYEVYDACRKHGAIVMTAHQHLYARSKIMHHFEKLKVGWDDIFFYNDEEEDEEDDIDDRSSNNTTTNNMGKKKKLKPVLNIGPGKSFAVVNGLGGDSIRSWEDHLERKPWWAANAAQDNDANYGALLCTFHVHKDPALARCKFQDISGKIWDEFYVRTSTAGSPPKKGQVIPTSSSLLNNAKISYPSSSQHIFQLSSLTNGADMNDTTTSSKFIEIPIAQASDIQETFSSQSHNSSILGFSSSSSSKNPRRRSYTLKFKGLGLRVNDTVINAHLQVMGARRNKRNYTTESSPNMSFTIRGHTESLITPSQPSNNNNRILWHDLKRRSQLIEHEFLISSSSQVIEWMMDEWETGEVWISPDLSPIINELLTMSSASFLSSSVLLENLVIEIQGHGIEDGDGFYGVDGEGMESCLNPTLAMSLSI